MATEKQKSDFEQAYVVEAETFRDSVGTMDNTGKRKWVFPRKPKGKYTNYRNIVSTILLIVFFVLPFLKINGNPVLKFNILDREFFIFGQPFYPQDFYSDNRCHYRINLHYTLYCCVWKNFLWMDMSPDNFYGKCFP